MLTQAIAAAQRNFIHELFHFQLF